MIRLVVQGRFVHTQVVYVFLQEVDKQSVQQLVARKLLNFFVNLHQNQSKKIDRTKIWRARH